ncbi:hypothetical protein K2P47_03725 [Patescibacteria group bacterium]|nr:hypothetical protein [Patescibacteria group bacterium]
MNLLMRAVTGTVLVTVLLVGALYIRSEVMTTPTPSVTSQPVGGVPKMTRPARSVPADESDAIGKIKIQP